MEANHACTLVVWLSASLTYVFFVLSRWFWTPVHFFKPVRKLKQWNKVVLCISNPALALVPWCSALFSVQVLFGLGLKSENGLTSRPQSHSLAVLDVYQPPSSVCTIFKGDWNTIWNVPVAKLSCCWQLALIDTVGKQVVFFACIW